VADPGSRGSDPDSDVERYCPSCERSFTGMRLCPDDGAALVQLGGKGKDPLIGRDFEGRFELREKMGRGGMGTVYRAWQRSMGREVAVKVIRADQSGDPAAAKRFLREARLSSRIGQPNCVSVHEFGQSDDGLLYIAMEILHGRTLSELLRTSGALPEARVVGIAVQILDALEAAHRLGIIHRDIKPSNVIVLDQPVDRDFVKVLDFGLARSLKGDDTSATLTRELVGTPAYMPAEVARNEEVDERSDLYSLGVLLWQLLTGRLPFEADSTHVLVAMHASYAPPELPGSVSEPLRSLVMRLLAKQPAERPPSAAAVRALLLGQPVPARGPVLPAPTRDPVETPSATSAPDRTATMAASPASALPVSEAAAALSVSAAAPVSAALPVSAPPPARRRGGVIAVVVMLVVAAAAVVVWRAMATRSGRPGTAAPAQSSAAVTLDAAVAPAEVVAASAADAASPRAAVELELVASPSAEVLIDGVSVGSTPVTRTLPATPRQLLVEFRRSGYRTETRKLVGDLSQRVSVTLRPRKAAVGADDMFLVPARQPPAPGK